MSIETTAKTIKSPCMGVCALDDDYLCIACKRSGTEIAEWGVYSNEEKIDVLQKIEQRYQIEEESRKR